MEWFLLFGTAKRLGSIGDAVRADCDRGLAHGIVCPLGVLWVACRMTLIWLSIAWVFASVGVAMLPMRKQYFPGVALLLAAPVLIIMTGVQFGWVYALLALAAFISMFRNPLRYIVSRLRGQKPEIPE